MIGVTTSVEKSVDVATAFDRGLRKGLLDVGQAGFNASQDRIAEEASDTGNLLRSGFGPEVDEQTGEVFWGYAAPYAEPVDKGADPHWPPIKPLKKWARRVLGSAALAWAVAGKIAEKGTEPVHFVKAGEDTMKARLRAVGLSGSIETEYTHEDRA